MNIQIRVVVKLMNRAQILNGPTQLMKLKFNSKLSKIYPNQIGNLYKKDIDLLKLIKSKIKEFLK